VFPSEKNDMHILRLLKVFVPLNYRTETAGYIRR